MELQKIITDTFKTTDIDEKTIKALNRVVQSAQDKIVLCLESPKLKLTVSKIKTNKIIKDHSITFKDTHKVINQFKQQEKVVAKAMSEIKSDIKGISESTKMISNQINMISQGLGMIQTLSYVSVALSAANLCATLATFAIMNAKLDSIQCGIDIISKKMDQLLKQQEIKMNTDISKLVFDYKHMLDEEEKGSEYSRESYRKLLMDIYLYDIQLIMYFINNAVNNKDDVLNAIYLLSGMLAQVIKRYDNAYYFDYMNEKVTIDPAHDDWMKIFDLLSSKEFLQIVFEHCYFGKKLSNRQSMEVISNLYYSQINSIALVGDNILITHQTSQAKQLEEFWSKMNALAYNRLQSDIKEEYEHLEEKPTISQEEIEQKTREAAIKLGYIKA